MAMSENIDSTRRKGLIIGALGQSGMVVLSGSESSLYWLVSEQ